MDLNELGIDPLTKGIAGGGFLTVLIAVAWKKIIEFRQDKRDDEAGQISQKAFTNIVKGLNEEIDRINEALAEARKENRALSTELSAEIKLRFATERKLEAAQKGVAETVTKVEAAKEAVTEAATAAGQAATTVDGPAASMAGRILADRIAELEGELSLLRERNGTK